MASLRSILLLITHYSLLISVAHADGIKFFHGSWAQVMAEARRENKPIFVDVYTTWCGPCKLMAAKAFPDARVGAKMNAGFINYKIDAERGEGETIAKRYGVQAFPTSLFVGSDGRLIRRTMGYNGIDSFLAEAQRALSDANATNAMNVWNKRFDAGERSPEFLRGMLQKQLEYDRPTGDVLDAYVATLPKTDTLAVDEVKFLTEMLATTYTTAYVLLAKQKLYMMIDSAKRPLTYGIVSALGRAERNDLADAVAAQDEPLLENLIKNKAARKGAEVPQTLRATVTTSPDYIARLENEADDLRLKFYKSSRLSAHYVSLLKKIADTRLMTKTDAELNRADSLVYIRSRPLLANLQPLLPDSVMQSVQPAFADSVRMSKVMSAGTARRLCELAKGLTENSADKKDLAQALRWTERATQIDSSPRTLITHAHLLNRAGRKPDARSCLQKGIAQQTKEADKAPLQLELKKIQ